MHEIGLMQQTLDVAFQHMAQRGATRVLSMKLRIGPLAGVVREALEFAFEALAPGTAAEGARLAIEGAPIICYCQDCRHTFEVETYDYECPTCSGLNIEIRSGAQMELVSMEVS